MATALPLFAGVPVPADAPARPVLTTHYGLNRNLLPQVARLQRLAQTQSNDPAPIDSTHWVSLISKRKPRERESASTPTGLK